MKKLYALLIILFMFITPVTYSQETEAGGGGGETATETVEEVTPEPEPEPEPVVVEPEPTPEPEPEPISEEPVIIEPEPEPEPVIEEPECVTASDCWPGGEIEVGVTYDCKEGMCLMHAITPEPVVCPTIACSFQKCPHGCKVSEHGCITNECLPKREVPEGCKEIIDESGYARVVCEIKEECLPIDPESKRKCEEQGGRPDYYMKGNCEFLECRFEEEEEPVFIEPVTECPSKEELEEIFNKCRELDLEAVVEESGGCEYVNCIERREPEIRCDEVKYRQKRKECVAQDWQPIEEYDEQGCPIINCIPPREHPEWSAKEECKKDIPPGAYQSCEARDGELVVKRRDDGCIEYSKCLTRGSSQVKYEKVEEVPPASKLLSVAFSLEEIKMKFDQLARKTEAISKYYYSVGNDYDGERFERVAGMFESAMHEIDNIKLELRDRIRSITTRDLMELKQKIRYITDTIIEDILWVILGGGEPIRGPEEPGLRECGNNEDCFMDALRICEPVIFTPNQETKVEIIGIEDKACVLEVEAISDGRGVDMICKYPDYAFGFRNPEEELLPHCKGSMVEEMERRKRERPIAEPSEFKLCTPEDERKTKECSERGGQPQSDPHPEGGCEVYTNCMTQADIIEAVEIETLEREFPEEEIYIGDVIDRNAENLKNRLRR